MLNKLQEKQNRKIYAEKVIEKKYKLNIAGI